MTSFQPSGTLSFSQFNHSGKANYGHSHQISMSNPESKKYFYIEFQDIYDDETDGMNVEEAEEKNLSQSSDFYPSPSPKHFLHTVCINKPPRLTYQPKLSEYSLFNIRIIFPKSSA